MDTIWFELTLMASLFAIGHIVFAHFEVGTPRWRKVVKFVLFMILTAILVEYAGRVWFYSILSLMFLVVLVLHAWWLPKKGINGWTAEPRDKYYQLRGWKLPT